MLFFISPTPCLRHSVVNNLLSTGHPTLRMGVLEHFVENVCRKVDFIRLHS